VTELRILLLEDSSTDAELVERNLRDGGLVFTSLRVYTELAFKQALNNFKPDVVLADYQLPNYTGRAALDYVRLFYPDIPVIIVTGSIGEETAVELLKRGARDYILKDRLIRLPSAIQKALREQEEIRLRRESEQRLRESEALFKAAQSIAHVGSWSWSLDGNEASCSDETFRIIGYTPGSVVLTRELILNKLLVPEDREKLFAAINMALEGKEENACEFRIRRPDGEVRHLLGQTEIIRDNSGKPFGLVGTVMDITERMQTEEKIRSFAFYDMLTQLPNRRLLLDRLWQAMAASKRSGRYGALMFIDLDNFKLLNDRHGHEAGDLLLVKAAHRIAGCLRATDTVARFGGDEFVVMLSELGVAKAASITQAGIVAEKIRATLAEPYLLKLPQQDNAQSIVVEYRCTSSIGVVVFFNHHANQKDLLRWADMAMYQAKADGRDRIRFFDPQSWSEGKPEKGTAFCFTLPSTVTSHIMPNGNKEAPDEKKHSV
jgi:diguanylate cyclase (GGDEF)-like protein/PAS domain S-box-containing protein